MSEPITSQQSGTTWFVGASFGHTDDQSARFLEEGIWEISSPSQKEQALVRSMRPGERIAIKAAYVRKHGLPFDNRQQTVSVMGIKATGVITENPQDRERVKVQWQAADGVREWYFYTYRPTIWRIVPGEWNADALIAFAFEGKPQDIERFRNAPYWKDRFGTLFQWADFYKAVAEKLLSFARDRAPLIQGIHQIAQHVQGLDYLQDKLPDGSKIPLQDICPFTAMGTFNRGMTDANRKLIAAELAKLLGVNVPVPATFEGIPVLNNQRSWFFRYADKRGTGDIDALWRVFAAAQALVEDSGPDTRDEFIEAYDAATQVWGVAWNLSTGLYWTAPWEFPTLDSQSRHYIQKRLGVPITTSTPQAPCDAATYLQLADDLRMRFAEEDYPVHSFPELSLASWQFKDATPAPQEDDATHDMLHDESGDELAAEVVQSQAPMISSKTSRMTAASCRSQSLSWCWIGCAPRKI